LNATAVAPVKPVPVMVTVAPGAPLAGVKLVIVGGAPVTLKLPLLVAVPLGVVTVTGPLVALAGTVALIWVSEATPNVAAVPLNATAVAPVKPVPLIVTAVPGGPLDGVNPVIVGGGPVTVKLLLLVAVPLVVVTVIGPVLAPAGTVVLICVSEATV